MEGTVFDKETGDVVTDETTASKADSSYDNIFHIFEKDDNTPYGYIGSVYHDKTSDYSNLATVNGEVYNGAGNAGSGPLFVDNADKVDQNYIVKDIENPDYEAGDAPEPYQEETPIENNVQPKEEVESESQNDEMNASLE